MSAQNKPPKIPPFMFDVFEDSPDELHEAAAVTDHIVDLLIDTHSVGMQPFTDDQLDAVRLMVEAGMMYGWQFAQADDDRVKDDMRARSGHARRSKAVDHHAMIRDAWEQALAQDPDITVAALAERLGVGRATAYRAIRGVASR